MFAHWTNFRSRAVVGHIVSRFDHKIFFLRLVSLLEKIRPSRIGVISLLPTGGLVSVRHIVIQGLFFFFNETIGLYFSLFEFFETGQWVQPADRPIRETQIVCRIAQFYNVAMEGVRFGSVSLGMEALRWLLAWLGVI
jgi:hypothetical protein